ncbi:hypothetical protein TNCT_566581 [Trichonephila clavata]|uniref:DUF4817 domain-containing protein n=1 Tax=Trichonephila clavata TaxID=2740835 RepID=A0A8X6L3Y4_TRICU|nr:hypothetical protein TNCT_566581 [Trichonephila clavata]
MFFEDSLLVGTENTFLGLESHHLDHSFVALRRSFQRKFNIKNGLTNSIIKTLFEKFQRTVIARDDRAGNIGHSNAKVTEVNVVLVQQVIQLQEQISVRLVACQIGLQQMTKHRILHNSFQMFSCKIHARKLLSSDDFNVRETYASAILLKWKASEIDVGDIDLVFRRMV